MLKIIRSFIKRCLVVLLFIICVPYLDLYLLQNSGWLGIVLLGASCLFMLYILLFNHKLKDCICLKLLLLRKQKVYAENPKSINQKNFLVSTKCKHSKAG